MIRAATDGMCVLLSLCAVTWRDISGDLLATDAFVVPGDA